MLTNPDIKKGPTFLAAPFVDAGCDLKFCKQILISDSFSINIVPLENSNIFPSIRTPFSPIRSPVNFLKRMKVAVSGIKVSFADTFNVCITGFGCFFSFVFKVICNSHVLSPLCVMFPLTVKNIIPCMFPTVNNFLAFFEIKL